MLQTRSTSITLMFFFWILNSGCSGGIMNSQKIVHDTIFIEKKFDKREQTSNELKGTTVLTSSEKNMESGILHGLWLKKLTSSECQVPTENPRPTEITSIKQTTDSTLIITANITANCSYDFLGEVEIKSGNTINLIYHGYGGYAECNCDFTLTYNIEIVRDGDYNPEKLKYITIGGIAKKSLPKIR